MIPLENHLLGIDNNKHPSPARKCAPTRTAPEQSIKIYSQALVRLRRYDKEARDDDKRIRRKNFSRLFQTVPK